MNAANFAFHALQGVAKTVPANPPVHVCKSLYGRRNRHVVLIEGEYYEVSPRGLENLRSGMTPADLDLDPMTDDEVAEFGED